LGEEEKIQSWQVLFGAGRGAGSRTGKRKALCKLLQVVLALKGDRSEKHKVKGGKRDHTAEGGVPWNRSSDNQKEYHTV